MTIHHSSLHCLLGCFLLWPTLAQSQVPLEWRFDLRPEVEEFAVPTTPALPQSGLISFRGKPSDELTLVVECNTRCADLRIHVRIPEPTPTRVREVLLNPSPLHPTERTRVWQVQSSVLPESTQAWLVFTLTNPAQQFFRQVMRLAPEPPSDPAACSTINDSTLDKLQAFATARLGRPEHDPLVWIVSTSGIIHRRPTRTAHEEDRIGVVVYGRRDVVETLTVRRSSASRDPDIIHTTGAPSPSVAEKLVSIPAKPLCGSLTALLSDFAPPRAEIAILRWKADEGKYVDHTKFDFSVARRYRGALWMGTVWTQLDDPEFGLTDQKRIYVRDRRAPGMRYVVGATAYTRPVAFGTGADAASASPFLAFTLDRRFDDVMGGVSFALFGGQVQLLAGVHAGRVNRLEGGYRVGASFSGEAAALPVSRTWQADLIVGAGFNLQIAGELVKAFAAWK